MEVNRTADNVAKHKKAIIKNRTLKAIRKNKTLVIMCLPAVVFFFIFSYLPMPGAYVAFVNFSYRSGIFGSPFVGFDNFKFLALSGQLLALTQNTVLYNLAFILIGNMLQIFIAVLLNEIAGRRFKKVSQSVMFLPYFISVVIIGLFAYNLLNVQNGFLNSVLKSMGRDTFNFYGVPWIWPIVIVLVYLWQNTGYGSIIYFAAIMGIDTQIFEASQIDGANVFQRIRYIMLPCLKPTFIILLLFSLGSILKGNFGLFYNLVGSNSLLYDYTDIIETFVFRSLMVNFNFSMGAAVGLYQSVFGFILVVTVNWIVKRIEPDYSLF